MRIYGNRLLKTLPGQATRPTTARVREALFNIWQGTITDCQWLDLCAGNGSMGAESLCRGAKYVVGIEKSARACTIIRENWQQVGSESQKFKVLRGDVVRRLKSIAGEQFSHIYFDPPYQSKLYQPVLEAIAQSQILAPNGELAVEHNPQFWQATDMANLVIYRQKKYSRTTLTFYRLENGCHTEQNSRDDKKHTNDVSKGKELSFTSNSS